MEIIDNFLPEKVFESFSKTITGTNFPWFLCNVLEYDATQPSKGIDEKTLCNPLDNYQFSYLFYSFLHGEGNQPHKGMQFDLIYPFIEILEVKRLIQVKANLIVRTNNIIEHGYHTDHPYKDAKTAVFYVNDNDGYTKFETGAYVESVANRLVIFDGGLIHSASEYFGWDIHTSRLFHIFFFN